MGEFKGNSFKGRSAESDGPKIEPVVSQRPIVNKKKWRLIDALNKSPDKNFGEWVIQDIVVPNMNKMIGMTLQSIISQIFGVGGGPGWGNTYHYTNGWWNNGPAYTNYSAQSVQGPQNKQQAQQRPQAGTDLSSYVMRTREDAEMVLEGLDTYLETYDAVPVSAFFSLIGVTAPYTYNDYGWMNLSEAKVVPSVGGFSIHFPKPVRLKN